MTSQRLQQGIKQRLAHDIRSQNISLCWVNNCYDNNPQEDSLTVGELIDRFSEPDLLRGERRLGLADYLALDKTIPEEKERRDAEKNGQGFIPAWFKQRGTKLARDVATIYAFVLDLDGGVTQEEFQLKLADCAYLAHTSYSHSTQEERWRVIIFYDIPCTPAQHAFVFAHFNSMFGGRIDPSSKKLSQLWYTPACPHDALELFQSFFNDAALFNPYAIGTVAEQTRAIDKLKSRVEQPTCAANEERARQNHPEDDILSGSPDPDRVCCDGERTGHLTRLAGLWIARGYRLDDVKRLARAWNAHNSPPLDDGKVIATCDGIHATHCRNHGQTEHVDISDITPLFAIEANRAGRFIDKKLPPRRWLFVDVLPFGKVGIIVAPGGTGKSQALLQVGVSVVTGSPLFGAWEVGETGSVLVLLAEDDDEEIQRRLYNIMGQIAFSGQVELISALRNNLIVKSMVSENNLMTETGMSREVKQTSYVARLIATAAGIPNLKLIILDPASRFRGGDENGAQDTTRFVEAVERVAQATGVSILIAHHTNKVSSKDSDASQNASRGSSALTDGVRWQTNLATMSSAEAKEYGINEDDRRFHLTATITKNNYAAPQPKIILKRGDGGYLHCIDLTPQRVQKTQDLKSKIVELVTSKTKAGERYSKTAFEAKFGGTEGLLGAGKNAVREALNELLSSHKLTLDSKKKLASPQRAMLKTHPPKPDTPIP